VTSAAPPRRRGTAVLLALGLVLTAVTCNKGPAEEALAAAEEALAAVRADLERFAPEEHARLRQTLEAARADFAAGDYTEALRRAQELPAGIRRAVEKANRRRSAEVASAWDDLSRELPALIARLRARVALASSPAAGPSDPGLEAVRAELQDIGDAWDEARAAFEGGDASRALATAHKTRTEAEALARRLPGPGSPGTGSDDGTPAPR
jgi:hypothetical protein